jgi:hypothetical protein
VICRVAFKMELIINMLHFDRMARLMPGQPEASALLALWSYLRWPKAAPSKYGDAVLRVVVAFVLLQVGTMALDAAVGAARDAAAYDGEVFIEAHGLLRALRAE